LPVCIVTLGKVLGRGGFGIVNEIKKFTLDSDSDTSHHNDGSAGVLGSGADNPSGSTTTANEKRDHSSGVDGPPPPTTAQASAAAMFVNNGDDGPGDHTHVHYDIGRARQWMEKQCLRRGEQARYALKRLHADLSPIEQARGMIDLAVEAKYLSVVWHPNISE
jgi:hypothetical protein